MWHSHQTWSGRGTEFTSSVVQLLKDSYTWFQACSYCSLEVMRNLNNNSASARSGSFSQIRSLMVSTFPNLPPMWKHTVPTITNFPSVWKHMLPAITNLSATWKHYGDCHCYNFMLSGTVLYHGSLSHQLEYWFVLTLWQSHECETPPTDIIKLMTVTWVWDSTHWHN